MHTNWHSDESDGSSWMDEQGSEGRQSSLTSSFLRPKTPGDALAEAVQRIQLDLDLWQESYDGEITTGLEEAWAAIARQVDEVSKQVAAKAIFPPPKPKPSLLTIPIMSPISRRRINSIYSEAQAESDWAGLWYLLGNTDDDRNRRLGVNRGSSMPGDAYVLNQIWSCLDSRDFAAVAAVCTDWFRLVYHSKMGQRQWQHIASNRWRHIQDWDKNELVQLLCGSTLDWRKRFIALHSLSNNWITGKQTASVTSIQPPVLKCFQVVKPNEMLVAGDSRGWLRYLNVSGSDSSSQPAYQAHRYSIGAIATPHEYSNRVLTGSIDGSLSVHDILTGQLVGQLRPSHLDAITSLEMLDNERGLSASHDATVRLWDFRMGYPALVVFEDEARLVSVLGATASPDKTNVLAFYEVILDVLRLFLMEIIVGWSMFRVGLPPCCDSCTSLSLGWTICFINLALFLDLPCFRVQWLLHRLQEPRAHTEILPILQEHFPRQFFHPNRQRCHLFWRVHRRSISCYRSLPQSRSIDFSASMLIHFVESSSIAMLCD
ncbi:hypothetical protein AC1031_018290 [Aphanomyces cochlioides]|nr:hypothetical protein AC1031_018290 [Aphanomyces cochlioides]